MTLFRRVWQWFLGWITAMDYSIDDYIIDRVRVLEREVERLKDEKRQTLR
jgi:hypothetical protein